MKGFLREVFGRHYFVHFNSPFAKNSPQFPSIPSQFPTIPFDSPSIPFNSPQFPSIPLNSLQFPSIPLISFQYPSTIINTLVDWSNKNRISFLIVLYYGCKKLLLIVRTVKVISIILTNKTSWATIYFLKFYSYIKKEKGTQQRETMIEIYND